MSGRLALLVALSPACYFGSGPNVPYPSPEVGWERVSPATPLGPPPAVAPGARVVVVSRFRSLVPNPVGGLYDHTVQNLSPLWRTYFARNPEIAVMEGFADRLREAGMRALKDYTDPGNTALLEAPLRARRPIVIATTVRKLRHDQVRQSEPPGDFEAVTLAATVELREPDGARKAALEREVTVKLPAGGFNLLQVAGAMLADSLLTEIAAPTKEAAR
jgi:hypothetical protein